MRTIRRMAFMVMVTTGMILAGVPAPASAAPSVTFTLLTPLPTELAIGESVVIGVRVESSEPFVMAIALSNAYFPGRGVSFGGSPAHPGDTVADFFLTITGRASTADLPPAQDWPYDEDWPGGVAPVAVAVGARFAGGGVVGTQFPFAVKVA